MALSERAERLTQQEEERLWQLVSKARRERVEQVLSARLVSLTVVLEDLYNPVNASAVLRSCEAFGVGRVHVVDGNGVFKPHRKAAGRSLKWMEITHHPDVAQAYASLRAQGFRLLASARGEAACELHQLQAGSPTALVFGNEHIGLSDEAIEGADGRFWIETQGFVESLNVSVAAAVSLAWAAPAWRAQLGRPGDLPADARTKLRQRWLLRDVPGAREILRRFREDGSD